MKKAAKYWSLAAFKLASGLASIERCLETFINTRFYVLKIDFVPPFVPPVCLWYPVDWSVAWRGSCWWLFSFHSFPDCAFKHSILKSNLCFSSVFYSISEFSKPIDLRRSFSRIRWYFHFASMHLSTSLSQPINSGLQCVAVSLQCSKCVGVDSWVCASFNLIE